MEGPGSGNMRFWSIAQTYSQAVQGQIPIRLDREQWSEWAGFYF